jgi:hypothetical protein
LIAANGAYSKGGIPLNGDELAMARDFGRAGWMVPVTHSEVQQMGVVKR